MGNYQNKENIAIAQAQVVAGQQLENKLNYFGIILVIIAAIMGILLCYAFKRGCASHAREWLRKEVLGVLARQPGTHSHRHRIRLAKRCCEMCKKEKTNSE